MLDEPLELLRLIGRPTAPSGAGQRAPRPASAPASRSRPRNAGMSEGCAATTAGPAPCAAAGNSTAAPASRAITAPAALSHGERSSSQ